MPMPMTMGTMGFMSPAYLMVAPQMAQMAGMPVAGMPVAGMPVAGMPVAGMPPSMGQFSSGDPASPTGTGGHVTHNPTNSLSAGGDGFGASAYPGGAFPGGAMASPVGFGAFMMAQPMMLAPVFFMPVFAGFAAGFGAGAQPPVAAEPPAAPVAEVPAAPVQVADDVAPPVSEEVVNDPEVVEDDFTLPIKQYSAEEFSRFRMKSLDAELVTSLQLSLKTNEGDEITLDFNQVDVLQRTKFAGRSLEGDRVRVNSFNEETDRVVNMNVSGDLSDSEKAAVDSVLARVIEVANKFFEGSVGAALNKLKTMEFDTGTLAELSLKMSMTKSVEFTRAYQGGEDQLRRLAERDGGINNMLEFFADEQKKLIDMASEVLDGESAVKLVKSLLPPMLEEPLQALVAEVADYEAPQPVEDAEGLIDDEVDS